MAKTAKSFSQTVSKLDDSTGPDSAILDPFYNFSSMWAYSRNKHDGGDMACVLFKRLHPSK